MQWFLNVTTKAKLFVSFGLLILFLAVAILAAYRRKYCIMIPLWMGRRIRKGLARKTSVLIRITPASLQPPLSS